MEYQLKCGSIISAGRRDIEKSIASPLLALLGLLCLEHAIRILCRIKITLLRYGSVIQICNEPTACSLAERDRIITVKLTEENRLVLEYISFN